MLAFASTWAKLAVVAHLLIVATASPFDLTLAARAGTVAPNQDCSTNADCKSNNCIQYQNFNCMRLHPNGSYAYNCDDNDNYLQNYCSGVALGQTCANQGECDDGRCNSKHKCVATVPGKDSCLTDLGCSGIQVCRNSTCFAPASASLNPRETCKSDSSCVSGRCVDNIAEGFVDQGIYPTRPECDVLQQNQTGCRNFYDCYDALCLNISSTTGRGTCKLGADGDRCVANFQCINVCSLDGVCYTPAPASLTKKETCTKNSQCISGVCNDFYFIEHYRPDFTNNNASFEWPSDLNCAGSPIGGKCKATADCNAGTCQNGVCKGKALGASCSSSTQCNSLSCTIPKGSKNGTCTIGAAYSTCSKNSDCYSNSCGSGTCPSECLSCPGSCAPKFCAAVPEGSKCRTDGDVGPYDACTNGISTSQG